MPRRFVLVHGAWHGGWCWKLVAEQLRALGHQVTAPTLTGLGERTHLLSRSITIQTFVEDVANHLKYGDISEAVIVGHSFAGSVLSGLAELCPERISALIYLDALIIQGGQSPFDGMSPEIKAGRMQRAEETSGGVSLPQPPVRALGIEDPDLEHWVQSNLTPHPLSTYLSPLEIKGSPGGDLPKAYIACVKPKYVPLKDTRSWVHGAGWPYYELQTGHDAMVTAPGATVERLLQVSDDLLGTETT